MQAAYAAASDNLKQTYAKGNNSNNNNMDSDSNVPPRKRRRSREVADKKAARSRERSSRNDTARKPNEDDKNRSAASTAIAVAQMEKEQHPQVHLVFQDYETSAMLVRETHQRKRHKSGSRNNNSTSTDSARNKDFEAPRPFISDKNQFDKSQLRLLSKNFAAALLGAVPPATTGHDPNSSQDAGALNLQPVDNDQQQESQGIYAKAEASLPEYDTKPSAYSKDPMDRQLEALAESKQIADSNAVTKLTKPTAGEKAHQTNEDRKLRNSIATNSGDSTSITENVTQKQMLPLLPQCATSGSEPGNAENSLPESSLRNIVNGTAHQEASMLSLPQCASSSFDPGQEEFHPTPNLRKKNLGKVAHVPVMNLSVRLPHRILYQTWDHGEI
jgi:hypothetical protein